MLHLGPFQLDAAGRRLKRGGHAVPLAPRAFDLLCALAEHGGDLVSKDDLLDAVWPGQEVEEANLHVQVSKLRKALGNGALTTVPGRGYRLALPVRALGAAAEGRPLSLVVLPFVEPQAPAEQAYFADAVTDDVTHALSRIQGAFVIASSTARALRGAELDLADVARELGVRNVLQGRIERSGQRLWLSARLADAQTLAVLWSDSIEVDAADLRALRHEVAARLAGALDLELTHVEAERGRRRPDPTATDLLLQARDALWRVSWDAGHWSEPLALAERALALEPDDPDALIENARLRLIRCVMTPVPDFPATLERAEVWLARALAVDHGHARGYYALSLLRRLQLRLDESIRAGEHALELQPNLVLALTNLGETLLLADRAADALAPLMRALVVSPRDPTRGFTWYRLARAQLLLGNPHEALAWLARIEPHMFNPSLVALWRAVASIAAGEVERGAALYRAHRGTIVQWYAWTPPTSRAYLRQWRRWVLQPLLATGAEPDGAPFEPWFARCAAAWRQAFSTV
jgi:TolB-like protein